LVGSPSKWSGKIRIFTERPPCASCTKLLQDEFHQRYRNIQIEIFSSFSGERKYAPRSTQERLPPGEAKIQEKINAIDLARTKREAIDTRTKNDLVRLKHDLDLVLETRENVTNEKGKPVVDEISRQAREDQLRTKEKELQDDIYAIHTQLNTGNGPTDGQRITLAEQVTGQSLTDIQRKGILAAHEAPSISEKENILAQSGFTPNEIRLLLKNWVTGTRESVQGQEKSNLRPQLLSLKQEVLINDSEGNGQPLTFSFDAEFGIWGFLKLLSKDADAVKKLDKLISFSAEALINKYNLDRKQFASEALKPGVPADQETYHLLDFNFQFIVENIFDTGTRLITKEHTKALGDLLKETLLKKGIRIDVSWEEIYGPIHPEIKHEKFETIPSKLWDMLKNIQSILSEINEGTHLHLGIPAIVPKNQVEAIQRALEARIILRYAMEPNPTVKQRYTDSGLAGNGSGRGFVKLGTFDGQQTHDLEIRAGGLDSELYDLNLASLLVLNRDRLRIPQYSGSDVLVRDSYTVNLNGALRYVGLLLVESGEVSRVETGRQMISMANQIEKKQQITPEMRKIVSEFLINHKVEELLEIPLFIETK
jgi:hypothetical protein